jgi:hypothetical protein
VWFIVSSSPDPRAVDVDVGAVEEGIGCGHSSTETGKRGTVELEPDSVYNTVNVVVAKTSLGTMST